MPVFIFKDEKGENNMLQIITDSSADLPEQLIKKYDIHVVPLTVRIDGREYAEGVDISPRDFWEKMQASSELPKTSQPSPAVFKAKFEELAQKGEVLCMTISSRLSGTYQSACTAADLSGAAVKVFDTLAGSLGHGLQVIKAAELAISGFSVDQIIEQLKAYRSKMNILILLDTLENIVKGGRLSRFQGSLAKILDIKVLLEGIEGAVEINEKVRGKRKFLNRVLEVIGQRQEDFSDTVFGITHIDNLEDAEYLKGEITAKYNPKDVLINEMGPTMGTYAGRGGMIVSF